ncbi:MAG: hypothetical protein J5927_00155 [Oscillospiraceae bacterium]|nr:hypothetical protein [Oscillospiraceae bacterium]
MQKITRILTESVKYLVLINLILLIKGIICEGPLPFCLSLSLVCPFLCGCMTVLAERNKAKAGPPA